MADSDSSQKGRWLVYEKSGGLKCGWDDVLAHLLSELHEEMIKAFKIQGLEDLKDNKHGY